MIYPRRPPKKKENLREHFEKRWKERVDGEKCAPFKLLNRAIQNQMSDYVKFVESISKTRTEYLIKWNNKKYTVIYNKQLNSVVTIYPYAERKN
jgi:ABC-type bacteriocin/lantibiotic exporter with double-glycine peptidase domain